jgi:hypothetical protein
MVGRSVPPRPGEYTVVFDKPLPRTVAPLAWCPLCELPRARLHTFMIGGVQATICACACARLPMSILPDGIRAIPMTENHDPGDEDRSC